MKEQIKLTEFGLLFKSDFYIKAIKSIILISSNLTRQLRNQSNSIKMANLNKAQKLPDL